MLEVKDVHVSHGALPALGGVSMTVAAGERVALVGANGAGKSTLVGAIAGLFRVNAGQIWWEGERLDGLPAHHPVGRGIATVPEGRRLFPQMSVEENLELGAYNRRARAAARDTLAEVYALLPRVYERRRLPAAALSGGEQQMVAIGRALMARPRLLVLDEPSLGLAPQVVDLIGDAVLAIHRKGVALLLCEQNVQLALTLTERAYVLENGRVTATGTSDALLADPRVREAYLGPLAVAS